MPNSNPLKIVYLLGAGATHAEIINLNPKRSLSEVFLKKNGLLIKHISKRVIEKAQGKSRYLRNIKMASSPEGSLNIELLISLIENNRISDLEWKINYLKKLVEEDISEKLTDNKIRRFYLHKALLELHEKIENKEKSIGFISLNYDHILDDAYKTIYGKPNYCFSSGKCEDVPLLKLHGSFNWKHIKIYGTKKTIKIIPLGINKNYLQLPYSFIWGRALEILIECDILRIIGCSLDQNDLGLIDLLFKAHLEKGKPFKIQIIDFEKVGDSIKENYGFFPEIIKPQYIEDGLIPDILDQDKGDNPFKIWLREKGLRMLKDDGVKKTKYLKKVCDL